MMARLFRCYLALLLVGTIACNGTDDTAPSVADEPAIGLTDGPDQVRGTLVQFNENGAWSWFQDERAVVDTAGGRLVVGSVANRFGVGGTLRDGDIDAVFFDLASGRRQRFTLKPNYTSYGGGDDHNLPAFLVRPDGAYLAVYAGHNNDTYSYYRIYDDGRWGPEQRFDWDTMPGGTNFPTTYSNLFYLAAEDRIYNIARTDDRSPNLMVSGDGGVTWTYGGQLAEPDTSIGYVNGYFKYTSDGVDRIDFIATEHHPRDYDTSIYHGYLQDGRSHRTDGTVLDDDVRDKTAPRVEQFTPVFAAGTVVDSVAMTHAWTIDLQHYPDGSLGALFKARAGDADTDHRFFHARLDGGQWTWTYLGKAGPKLFGREEDYTGLGALDPNDPARLYLSTPVDPRDGAELDAHELFEGVRGGDGSWTWQPTTWNSTRDNLRPIVPAWDAEHTAVLWWRGTAVTSQNYDAAVVGVVRRRTETVGPMQYVDATAANTRRADGAPLAATGPSPEPGAADDRWHLRTGVGNGDGVLTSAEQASEDAPVLATRAPVSEAGTYDVWVHFWADPAADWRIEAGLAADHRYLFRHMASQQVPDGRHPAPFVRTTPAGFVLYQAYLGRIAAAADDSIAVFVDDEAVAVGPEQTPAGASVRTWYDGFSYARVEPVRP